MFTKNLSVLCVLAVAALLPTQLTAEVINVNFSTTWYNDVLDPYSGLGAAPDAGTTWNNLGASNRNVPLVNSNNASSSVKITWPTYHIGDYSQPKQPISLFNDEIHVGWFDTTPAPFTVTGLPSGQAFDLYLYTIHATTFSLGANTQTMVNTTGDAFRNIATNPTNGNYVKFSGIADGTGGFVFYISENPATGSGSQLYGLQIATIPEPSAIVLLVTGLVGLLAYAWRKRK